MSDSGPRSSVSLRRHRKRAHAGQLGEHGVDSLPQLANPLAVDDADFEDALALARLQVGDYHPFDVTRPKGMQVQFPGYGQVQRFRGKMVIGIHIGQEEWRPYRESNPRVLNSRL